MIAQRRGASGKTGSMKGSNARKEMLEEKSSCTKGLLSTGTDGF